LLHAVFSFGIAVQKDGHNASGKLASELRGLLTADRVRGSGAVVNASRSIIYAFERFGGVSLPEIGNAAAQATKQMTNEIAGALRMRKG
jgi:hypothetical protein